MSTQTRSPTSDEAVSGTWSGSASSRYTLVDDHPDSTGADSLTHGTATAGNITFGFSAFTVPAGATSISVSVLYYDQKSGSPASAFAGRLKVGGNYYNATTHNPANGTWTLRTDTWSNNPKTGAAWTPAQINGTDGTNDLQAFGAFSDDANPAILLASTLLSVTFTDPTGAATITLGDATLSAEGEGGSSGGFFSLALLGAGGVGAPSDSASEGALSVTLDAATLAASGVLPITAASAITLAALESSSTGSTELHGDAAITLDGASLAAAAVLPITAESAATLGTLLLSSAALSGAPAAGGFISLALFEAGGGGLFFGAPAAHFDNGNPAAWVADPGFSATYAHHSLGLSVEGRTEYRTGGLAVTLDALSLSSASTLPIVGAVSVTLGSATLASAGAVALQAASEITLGDAGLDATGIAQTTVIAGSASITLGDAALAGSGTVAIAAAAAVTLDGATLSATGVLPITGRISGSTPLDSISLTATGSGGLLRSGAAAVTLGAATLSAVIELQAPRFAAASITLGSIGLNAQGSHLEPLFGSASITLGDCSIVATISAAMAAKADITLGDCVMSSGIHFRPNSRPPVGKREQTTDRADNVQTTRRSKPTVSGRTRNTQTRTR